MLQAAANNLQVPRENCKCTVQWAVLSTQYWRRSTIYGMSIRHLDGCLRTRSDNFYTYYFTAVIRCILLRFLCQYVRYVYQTIISVWSGSATNTNIRWCFAMQTWETAVLNVDFSNGSNLQVTTILFCHLRTNERNDEVLLALAARCYAELQDYTRSRQKIHQVKSGQKKVFSRR